MVPINSNVVNSESKTDSLLSRFYWNRISNIKRVNTRWRFC
jgi:hypothetical protein